MDSQGTEQKNSPLRDLSGAQVNRLAHLQRDASIDKAELDGTLCAFQIRAARQFRGRSLNFLAKRVGISERTLARYETGGVKMPIRVAIQVLNLLGYRVVIERIR